jgi:large subunit ribosomal protein L15
MQLHNLKPIHKRKKSKRIGRGGKRGTYSGRGIKGQKARSGRKLVPIIREWIKRYPKLRGYKFKGIKKEYAIVNVGDLDKAFNDSEIVEPKTLIKKGLIDKIKGRLPKVKILGRGELKKKLVIKNCKLSEGALKKIKEKGGIVKD